MRALILDRFDSTPKLSKIKSTGRLGTGEIRLKIGACGLNFADTLMIKGRYQATPEPPFTLGMEVAGEILDCAPDVTTLRPGQRVVAFAGQGGLADEGVFRATDALPLPDEIDDVTAAALPVAYGTSHLGLAHLARLTQGETLLVTGAAGGVGLTAVEIGQRMGAQIIAVARGADKHALLKERGVTHVLDPDTDIRTYVKDLGGADVAYEAVGGEVFRHAFRALKPGGRLLVIGFASGTIPEIPANHLLVKNISTIGLNWPAYRDFAPEVLRGSLAQIIDWVAAGDLSPHVGAILPLDRATEGLEMLRNRTATGKIVITP